MRFLRTPLRRFAPLALAAVGLATLAAAASDPLILWNATDSVPTGRYLRIGGPDQIAVGDIVAVRQPAAARGNLTNLGYPSSVPLLKRVAAVAGGTVCHRDGATKAGGARLAIQSRDRTGRALPVWTECRRLRHGEVFLVGDTAGSFDSRYFGPVQADAVVGRYERWGS